MTFTCKICANFYKAEVSNEDMQARFKKNFPHDNVNKAYVVCERCYNLAMRIFQLQDEQENWIRYAMNE